MINGASGSVGVAAIQLARERGASVIGTASLRQPGLRALFGAEPTTYGDGVVERVRALAPGGVDRALDAAGHGALPALVELTGSPEQVVTIADYLGRGADRASGSAAGWVRSAPGPRCGTPAP